MIAPIKPFKMWLVVKPNPDKGKFTLSRKYLVRAFYDSGEGYLEVLVADDDGHLTWVNANFFRAKR